MFKYLMHSFFPCFFFVPMQQRYMVVRETDGVLRTASWEERDKLNQIYFPIDGREIELPAVFQADIMKVSRLLLTINQSIARSNLGSSSEILYLYTNSLVLRLMCDDVIIGVAFLPLFPLTGFTEAWLPREPTGSSVHPVRAG